MKYLATFYTHYGAMCFHKRCQSCSVPSTMAPVPRELSASCGVCVRFESKDAPNIAAHEDMESCYAVMGDGAYVQVGS